jgi:hypothetical protein
MNQPHPMGMITHAVTAAARRHEGNRKPAASTRTLAVARAQCPIIPARTHRYSPGGGVSQLPITPARPSARMPGCFKTGGTGVQAGKSRP